MAVTKSIPTDYLRGLEVHRGDTLRVLEVREENILVEIQRAESVPPQVTGAASEWLRTARGSVSMTPNESADEARVAQVLSGSFWIRAPAGSPFESPPDAAPTR